MARQSLVPRNQRKQTENRNPSTPQVCLMNERDTVRVSRQEPIVATVASKCNNVGFDFGDEAAAVVSHDEQVGIGIDDGLAVIEREGVGVGIGVSE